ncbi:MAG TPA: ATP-grasp domain-containing protein, partial [Candidatus Atribacteria bacterium]|nr:ATP-grasp domain-containing protein [Candidatus Atribacteria bacterium]
MDKVIVADAELRTSLAVIRSLSKYGLRVISIGRGKTGGYLTKYIWKKFDLSGSIDREYVDFIINTAKLEKVKAIFAHFEKTLLQLHERIAEQNLTFKLVMPPIEIFKFACKKENVLSVAKELSIPVPETIYYNSNDNQNLYEIVKKRIPCFIKTTVEIDIPPGPGNRYLAIKTENDLKFLSKFIEKHKTLLIQQYIEGYGCGIGGVFYDGVPIVIGGHIRLRESFGSGGVSTYCESKIHKEALNYATKLMSKLKWSGIAMIEFKVGREDTPYFMEVNPRIWGTIPLYIASGINVPVAAYKIFANGCFNDFGNDFKEGIKMRFLTEDLHAITAQYKSFRKIMEFIKVFLNMFKVKEGTFDIRDPIPFIVPIAYN